MINLVIPKVTFVPWQRMYKLLTNHICQMSVDIHVVCKRPSQTKSSSEFWWLVNNHDTSWGSALFFLSVTGYYTNHIHSSLNSHNSMTSVYFFCVINLWMCVRFDSDQVNILWKSGLWFSQMLQYVIFFKSSLFITKVQSIGVLLSNLG